MSANLALSINQFGSTDLSRRHLALKCASHALVPPFTGLVAGNDGLRIIERLHEAKGSIGAIKKGRGTSKRFSRSARERAADLDFQQGV